MLHTIRDQSMHELNLLFKSYLKKVVIQYI